MPFFASTPASVDLDELYQKSLRERMKYHTTSWADHGYGYPRFLIVIYLVKFGCFYLLGGLALVVATSHVGGLFEPSQWWTEPIVYQKFVAWTVLIELLGVGGAWGPLAGHFKPWTGGWRYWLRPGTFRLPPWPTKIPFTAGDTRTVGDVGLYAATLAALLALVVLPGTAGGALAGTVSGLTGGLMSPWPTAGVVALLIVLGLRDKTLFLAARGEQFLPILLVSTLLGMPDLIIAAKLIIVTVWVGAAISKLTPHFIYVIPAMSSNAPGLPLALKRRFYRHFPDDLRPSRLAWFMAHVTGTIVEGLTPLVLLFSTNRTVTFLAVILVVCFHLYIISTIPMAVPLEWNVLFVLITVFLFLGYPAQDGYGILDFSQGWMLPVILAGLLFCPVLGNLRPDLVSFLPAMRQYAGNWATTLWAFAPGAEDKLDKVGVPQLRQHDQLLAMGQEPAVVRSALDRAIAWRAMHSHGRGTFSVAERFLGNDIEACTLRDGEIMGNHLLGWSFGCGHMHGEQLVRAVQRRVGYAPGELTVVFAEAQPIHKRTQEYYVMDAAVGIVERGTWLVADAVREQPWLPNGPILHDVSWTHPTRSGPKATRLESISPIREPSP